MPRLPAAAQRIGAHRARAAPRPHPVAVRQPRVRDVLHRRPGVRGARSRLGADPLSARDRRRDAGRTRRARGAPAARGRGEGRAAAVSPAAVDLAVRIGSLALRNPVVTASGTFGYGDEYAHVVDLATIGAVITKTVTLEPRAGNQPARIAETAGGMLNSIGLENVGLERFRREKLPKLAALDATVIASLGGETPAELAALLEALGREKAIGAFELNFSCPNVSKGGAIYWTDARRLERTLRQLKPLTRAPLIAKLSPDVTSIAELARACEQGGADAITAVNTFVGMALDLDAAGHRLNRSTGGLSGPAIKPLALARCHEAARAVRIPVLGSGGIMSGRDALEFIAVGATAVQVGTASFIRPRAAAEVVDGMRAFLAARGIRRIAEWRGRLMEPPATPARRAPAARRAKPRNGRGASRTRCDGSGRSRARR
ncbi:MAG: dihydroorotate dehydrogenase [Candidatus Eisenbacteria bacterium]|nr:dihydroorotate dehydrogenase [Candidatus Eisenbacteria bacterium]